MSREGIEEAGNTVVQMTPEQLERIVSGVRGAAPAPVAEVKPRVAAVDKVLAEFEANPETDHALLAGQRRIISAMREDYRRELEEEKLRLKSELHVGEALGEIDRALKDAFKGNTAAQELSPYIRQKLANEFDTSPEYAEAKREFARTGKLDPSVIEKMVAKEAKKFLPEGTPNAKTAAGITNKSALNEQSKMAEEGGGDEGDGVLMSTQTTSEREKMQAKELIWQKAGNRVKGKDGKHTKEFVDYYNRSLKTVRAGEQKAREAGKR